MLCVVSPLLIIPSDVGPRLTLLPFPQTDDVKNALSLVRNALEMTDRITMKQFVGIFRGSNARMSNDLDVSSLEEHGCGKSYDLGDAERLFETLLIEQAFEEVYVANAGGFSNAYVKVGLAAPLPLFLLAQMD